MTPTPPPYFDFLLSQLNRRNASVERSFGRHVHWGYWADPASARDDDEDYARAAERLTLEVCAMAGIADGHGVLDVGCGFGGTIASLNERHRGLRLAGVNIDPRQIERARRLTPALNGNAVEFVAADACALPFRDSSFDRLLAVECAFHFPSRATFLREAYRVLKPGGVLALSDFLPAPAFLPVCCWSTASWFERLSAIGRFDVSCTRARYRRVAAAAGFAPMAERDATANTLPTYDYVRAMLSRNASTAERTSLFAPLLAVNRLLGRLGLMNYYLLAFAKPA